MADLPLPSADKCLTPLVDTLVDNPASVVKGYGDPARLEHINYGVGNWSNVLAGWKAQATLNLRRVADEMLQARLPLATGQGLRALAASKFFVNVVDTPTKSIGVVQLARGSGRPQGFIPLGTRFRRNANPIAVPVPIQAADFVSTQPVAVSANQTAVTVPIVCVQTGSAGNISTEHGVLSGTDLQIVDTLFDTTFTVSSAVAAGGSTNFSDSEVRVIAAAQPQGRRGPTEGAIYAGAYLALGVRHAAVFEDLTNAQTVLFAADESWASDTTYWQPAVVQSLVGDGVTDSWVGFGCELNPGGVGTVDNVYLNVVATIQLRSQNLLTQTSDIQTKIVAKLTDYFNNRPDWYTFRASAVRGVVARADPRILTCTSVTITDRFANPVADPAAIPYGTAPTNISHYSFLSLTPTFQAPV